MPNDPIVVRRSDSAFLAAYWRTRPQTRIGKLRLAFLLSVALADSDRHRGEWRANAYRRSLTAAEQRWGRAITSGSKRFPSDGDGIWDLDLALWAVRSVGAAVKPQTLTGSWIAPIVSDTGVAAWTDPTLLATAQQNVYLMAQVYDELLPQWIARLQRACVRDPECNKGVSAFFSKLHVRNGGVLTDGGIAASTPAQVVQNSEIFSDEVRRAARPNGTIRLEVGQAKEIVEADFELVIDLKKRTIEAVELKPERPDDLEVIEALDLSPAEYIKDPAAQAVLEKKARDADEAKTKALLKEAKGAVAAIATIAKLFDEDLASDLERVGKAAVQTAEAATEFFFAAAKLGEAFSVTTALGTAAATGNVVGAVVTLVSIFLDPEGTSKPDQAVRNEIKATRTDIKNLGKQMEKRFDRIDQALNKIYGTMVRRLDEIDLDLEEIRVDVARVQQTLAEQALTLQRVEDRLVRILKTQSRRELRSALRNGIRWTTDHTTPMSRPKFNGFVEVFRSYAVDYCTDPIETGVDGDRSLKDSKLAHELTAWPLHENVAFIDEYLRTQRPPWPRFTTPGAPPLANPFTWACAASAYAQLRIDWPLHGATLTEADSLQVRTEGERLAEALSTIAPNVQLFEKLHKNYDDKVEAFAGALQEAATAYLATTLRSYLALAAGDPSIDLWGAADQTVDYHAPGLATMRSQNGDNEVVAPAVLHSLVPQLCLNADWLAPAAEDELNVAYAAEWVDVRANPHNPRTDPDAPDFYGRVKLTVTARFADAALARRFVRSARIGFDKEDGELPDPGPYVADLSKNFGGSSDAGLSAEETERLRALLAALPLEVTRRMRAHQSRLFEEVARLVEAEPASPANNVAPAAVNVTGAKLLLESVVSLGFPRARAGDDLLRSMLRQAEDDPAGVLPDQKGFAAALRELEQPGSADVVDNAGSIGDWVIALASECLRIVRERLAKWREQIAAGNYVESVPIIERSLLRVDIAQIMID